MGLSSTQLITDLRSATGVDSTDYPDAKCLVFLNRSWWEVCDKFKFREKETQTTLVTVASTRDVSIPADCYATRIVVAVDEDENDTHIQLEQIDEITYESLYAEDSEQEGFPEKYLRYGSVIRLYPTPDAVYNLVAYYWKTLSDLSVLNDPSIPQSWHEIVLFGGIWRLKAELGDLETKASFQMDQQRLIESSSSVVDIEKYDSQNFHAQFPGYSGSKYR